MKTTSIILDLPPTGTNHAYHTNNGRWYKDDKISVWEKAQLYKLKGVRKPPQAFPDELTVSIGFFDKDKRRRDIDGRIKFVLDLLQKAGFYKDDCLITNLIVSKRYDRENSRLEICVF